MLGGYKPLCAEKEMKDKTRTKRAVEKGVAQWADIDMPHILQSY